LHKKFDGLRRQAEFGELPQVATIVLWRCQDRDVTLQNADMNHLVLESTSNDNLEWLQTKLDELN